MIIYNEDQEISEMYFFLEGTIGIGFSVISKGIMNRSFTVSKKWVGNSLIGDHYVVNKQKS